MAHSHDDKHHHDDGGGPDKSPKGPKEREIAATLTAATVALARTSVTYPDLEAAGTAVAGIYARMFDLVTAAPPRP